MNLANWCRNNDVGFGASITANAEQIDKTGQKLE